MMTTGDNNTQRRSTNEIVPSRRTVSLPDLLKTHFGYERFLPMQEDTIGHVLSGRDALVLMPTGGGKSLCYQLPALVFAGLTIVVSPLISLMKDQVDGLKANGIAAEFINSSLIYEEIDAIKERLKRAEIKLLYLAPERLAIGEFREFLRGVHISFIAIDEAHCISQWGHDFRPEYLNLKNLRDDFPGAAMMALTATATPRVRQDIAEHLRLKTPRIFLSSFDRPNLYYDIRPKEGCFTELLALLESPLHKNRAAIIYCFSRKNTEEIAEELRARGIRAEAYHAGLEAQARHDIQDRFLNTQTPVITATIAFGMGIDKPDIHLIVHYDLPKSIEGYYQETGRSGRDGLPAKCVLFYSYADRFKQEYFIKQMTDITQRRQALEKLNQLTAFCESFGCRRKFLLAYFGERYARDNCGQCDRCLRSTGEFDATTIGRLVLECVRATGGQFGAQYIIEVLRGSRNERILRWGHQHLPVYGQGQMFHPQQLKEIVGLLAEKGFLMKTTGEYPLIVLTASGRNFLNGGEPLFLPALRSTDKKSVKGFSPVRRDERMDHPALFEQLRQLRQDLAAARGVPPFVIFGDISLKEMARRLPQNAESFLAITGVGQQKLLQFGPAFMKKIAEFCREHGHGPAGPASLSNARRPDAIVTLTYRETKKLLEQKLSLAEMARARGLAVATILSHIERLAQEDPSLEINHLRPSESRFVMIEKAFAQAGNLRLSPVKARLGDDFSYEELRLARIFLTREKTI